MEKIKFFVEISKESFDLLKKIKEKGSAEYRDPEYENIGSFKNSDLYLSGKRDEEWYFSRNFGGTFYLVNELISNGLVDTDTMSWHLTFILTELGEKVLVQKEEAGSLKINGIIH